MTPKISGHSFTTGSGLTEIVRTAQLTADITGGVQVVHRHSAGRPCVAVNQNDAVPGTMHCFWVWPNLDSPSGLGGSPLPDREERLRGAAVRPTNPRRSAR